MAKPTKKKNGALAAAASRKLSKIGTGSQGYSPDQIVHAMFHAEERGDAQRVTFDDGTWGWQIQAPDGKVQILRPTPEILEAVDRFNDADHHGH